MTKFENKIIEQRECREMARRIAPSTPFPIVVSEAKKKVKQIKGIPHIKEAGAFYTPEWMAHEDAGELIKKIKSAFKNTFLA